MISSVQLLSPIMRRVLLTAAGLAALLAILGLLVFPTALADARPTLLALGAALLMLAAYAVLGGWAFARLERQDARLPRLALVFGLAAAAVYAGEVGLEYILLPSDNTRWGLAEFGLVFVCYLLVGWWAGHATRRARYGLLAAVGGALVSTLAWYLVVLALTYLMRGTPQQAAVFQAEGNYDDFARSGAADFQAWVLVDFYGAGFYHLLLGPLVAALLGGLGGLVGKVTAPRVAGRPAAASR